MQAYSEPPHPAAGTGHLAAPIHRRHLHAILSVRRRPAVQPLPAWRRSPTRRLHEQRVFVVSWRRINRSASRFIAKRRPATQYHLRRRRLQHAEDEGEDIEALMLGVGLSDPGRRRIARPGALGGGGSSSPSAV